MATVNNVSKIGNFYRALARAPKALKAIGYTVWGGGTLASAGVTATQLTDSAPFIANIDPVAVGIFITSAAAIIPAAAVLIPTIIAEKRGTSAAGQAQLQVSQVQQSAKEEAPAAPPAPPAAAQQQPEEKVAPEAPAAPPAPPADAQQQKPAMPVIQPPKVEIKKAAVQAPAVKPPAAPQPAPEKTSVVRHERLSVPEALAKLPKDGMGLDEAKKIVNDPDNYTGKQMKEAMQVLNAHELTLAHVSGSTPPAEQAQALQSQEPASPKPLQIPPPPQPKPEDMEKKAEKAIGEKELTLAIDIYRKAGNEEKAKKLEVARLMYRGNQQIELARASQEGKAKTSLYDAGIELWEQAARSDVLSDEQKKAIVEKVDMFRNEKMNKMINDSLMQLDEAFHTMASDTMGLSLDEIEELTTSDKPVANKPPVVKPAAIPVKPQPPVADASQTATPETSVAEAAMPQGARPEETIISEPGISAAEGLSPALAEMASKMEESDPNRIEILKKSSAADVAGLVEHIEENFEAVSAVVGEDLAQKVYEDLIERLD